MLPLLPEHLNQPVDIFIQTGTSNWSTPILSLLGVALGAGLAYLAGKKLEATRIKLEKLEEIVSFSAELEMSYSKYVREFLLDFYEDHDGKVSRRRVSGPETHDFNRQIKKLDFMMLVHFHGRDELRLRFRNNIVAVGTELALIAAQPKIDASEINELKSSINSMLMSVRAAQTDI